MDWYFKTEESVPIPAKDIVSWVFEDQEYDQDKPLWVDAANPDRTISCRQAYRMIRQLVAGLQEAGFQRGECVSIHSFNDIYYSMLFLGIVAAGGVFTGTNPSYTPHELSHHMRSSDTKFVITEPELLDNILAATKEVGLPRNNIFIFDTQSHQQVPLDFKSWRWLLRQGEKDWVKFDNLEEAQRTTAARLFSSGTTGLPKAAMITHHNFIAQHTLMYDINKPDYEVRKLQVAPEFHMAAVPKVHIAPLRSGHVIYVMRRFELEPYLANVERFKITELSVVPPVVISIIMSPLSKKYTLKSIRDVRCGSAPLDQGPQARFKALLAPGATVTQVWGMTESTCVATMFRSPEDDNTASVGRLLPTMEAKLIDDDGRNISGYDIRGEICLRGPCMIPGYYKNPQANATAFDQDGWFKTGDIAYCDGKSRKWYIVDRKKELIKVRGFQVAPLEIESVLISHPGIIDVAVIGVRVSDSTELPRAYVVRRPGLGDSLTTEDVRALVAQRLARYKNLDGGVRFVDAIPKNSTGKTLKRELREQAQSELIKTQAKL